MSATVSQNVEFVQDLYEMVLVGLFPGLTLLLPWICVSPIGLVHLTLSEAW